MAGAGINGLGVNSIGCVGGNGTGTGTNGGCGSNCCGGGNGGGVAVVGDVSWVRLSGVGM